MFLLKTHFETMFWGLYQITDLLIWGTFEGAFPISTTKCFLAVLSPSQFVSITTQTIHYISKGKYWQSFNHQFSGDTVDGRNPAPPGIYNLCKWWGIYCITISPGTGFLPIKRSFQGSSLQLGPGIPGLPCLKSAGLAGVSSGVGLDDGLLVCTLLLLI